MCCQHNTLMKMPLSAAQAAKVLAWASTQSQHPPPADMLLLLSGSQCALCAGRPDVQCSAKCQAGAAQVSPTWLKSGILAALTLASASLQLTTLGVMDGSSCCRCGS